MKPPPFSYHDPRTIADTVGLLGSLENAKLLAGGQSLMPMLNMRYVLPDHVIDLNLVEGLSYIREADGALEIGAMTRQREIEFSDVIKARCPLMQEAVLYIGHRQTRNRGTLGGSLFHLDPSAELVAVEREGYLQYLDERLLTLEAALGRVLRDLRRQLEQVRQRHVFQQPLVNISLQRERLSGQLSRWGLLVRHTFGNHQELLRVPEARLAALDPRRVLERGYALVTDGATGRLVTRREQLRLKQP